MKISLPVFDDVRVLVAGDLMLDRYWCGATERISPEAPVPAVEVLDFLDGHSTTALLTRLQGHDG
jgi:D-beta-D-heptose 7-phosphate kinase / D-beta-D-heptose 1-phosphate adenosyltransferase